jgi:hypothetical protein
MVPGTALQNYLKGATHVIPLLSMLQQRNNVPGTII